MGAWATSRQTGHSRLTSFSWIDLVRNSTIRLVFFSLLISFISFSLKAIDSSLLLLVGRASFCLHLGQRMILVSAPWVLTTPPWTQRSWMVTSQPLHTECLFSASLNPFKQIGHESLPFLVFVKTFGESFCWRFSV